MRVLCVAEKPSIARSIAQILSGGQYATRPTQNKYIRNYDFEYPKTNSSFTVTSVSGHLLQHDFHQTHRAWHSCDPFALFDAPIITSVPLDSKSIETNLLAEAKRSQTLMIWTDCDREGEHIGSEIVQICRKAKPNITIKRARFSAIIAQQIHNAAQNPTLLDYAQAAAVEARILLDLRIGAAFTRMQTLALKSRFAKLKEQDAPVSYGPCQFPTLGFVVSQYKLVKAFVPEPFWYIYLSLSHDGQETEFTWGRGRIYEYNRAAEIYENVLNEPMAHITKVTKKTVKKWKPYPLTTVELQKAASRLLKLAPKKVLDIAEKLYQQGFLSYPRTETDQFDPQFDLMSLIAKQTADPTWGAFATALQGGAFVAPRNGRNNDKAHPPIHPTAHVGNLVGDEKRVYEYITRRFLACCSKDAEGWETRVDLVCGGDEFHASGLVVTARNYLDVFPYDKWSGKVIPNFEEGNEFEPTVCELKEGRTTSPTLLTEADLVGLMDKNGIGTDATIATHIQTIIDRGYVIERMQGATKHLIPSTLGIGLIEGYNEIGFEKSLSKPQLRSETERSMVQVCRGTKTQNDMLVEAIEQYKAIFIKSKQEFNKVYQNVQKYLEGGVQAGDVLGRNGGDHENGDGAGDGDGRDGGDGGGGGRGDGGGHGGGGGGTSSGTARGGRSRGQPRGSRSGKVSARARGRGRAVESSRTTTPKDTGRGRGAMPRVPTYGRDNDGAAHAQERATLVLEPVSLIKQSSSSTEVKCRCGVPAVERTVTKESASRGRRFRNCGNRACDFFEWVDGPSSVGADMGQNDPGRFRANDAATLNKCHCQLTAVQRTVTKESQNKGKVFWSCPNSEKARCQYFEWADQPNASNGNVGESSSREMPGECYKCHQQGHWASGCPNNDVIEGSTRARSFGSQADNLTTGACYKCGRQGHYSNACPGESSTTNDKPNSSRAGGDLGACFKCNQEGHWSSACPNIGATPSTRGRASKRGATTKEGRGKRGRKK